MAEIRVLIVDDEEPARLVIKKYLQSHSDMVLVGECSNGFEALKRIQQAQPDIIFLDIQMPKISGFELLELLDEKPVIIFSTAFDQYALKAFEASAADYLLKPYSQERFAEAMNRARLFLLDRTEHDQALNSLVLRREQETEYLSRIIVKDGSKIQILPVEKLLRLEAQDDYVMLFTEHGTSLKKKTMKFFEQHLDSKEFVRIHRSHIIRISFIRQIELFGKESYKVTLKDGTRLPVSKSGHARLKQMLE